MKDIDCDWCSYGHMGFRPMPDHIGMLLLCRVCVRRMELQMRMNRETP